MNSAVITVHFKKKQLSGERFMADQIFKNYNKRMFLKILYRQTCNNVIYIGTKYTLNARRQTAKFISNKKKAKRAP